MHAFTNEIDALVKRTETTEDDGDDDEDEPQFQATTVVVEYVCEYLTFALLFRAGGLSLYLFHSIVIEYLAKRELIFFSLHFSLIPLHYGYRTIPFGWIAQMNRTQQPSYRRSSIVSYVLASFAFMLAVPRERKKNGIGDDENIFQMKRILKLSARQFDPWCESF